jgi:hypothetical protein
MNKESDKMNKESDKMNKESDKNLINFIKETISRGSSRSSSRKNSIDGFLCHVSGCVFTTDIFDEYHRHMLEKH